jgi:hypothetical protein
MNGITIMKTCRRVMKAMFEKLAHASIMRLNPASMDKLYDLMTMAVKHQVPLPSSTQSRG